MKRWSWASSEHEGRNIQAHMCPTREVALCHECQLNCFCGGSDKSGRTFSRRNRITSSTHVCFKDLSAFDQRDGCAQQSSIDAATLCRRHLGDMRIARTRCNSGQLPRSVAKRVCQESQINARNSTSNGISAHQRGQMAPPSASETAGISSSCATL